MRINILNSTSCKKVAKTVSSEAFIKAEKSENVVLAKTIGITSHR